MGYAELTLILVLIGYLHIRISAAEKKSVDSISEDEADSMIDDEMEIVDLHTAMIDDRMDRLEDSILNLHDKLDSLILGRSVPDCDRPR